MSSPNLEYAAQLRRLVGALAIGKNDLVSGDITKRDSVDQVEMFTSGNLEKRFDKLKDQLELLEEEIDELDTFINDYIESVPLQAYDTGSSDTSNFVEWLGQQIELTPEQRDLTVVIRSRNATEEIGRRNRMAHVQFQEIRSLVDELARELGANSSLRIRLNPVRLWAVFESSMFAEDEDSIGEIEVLFYAYENEVRTAMLEPEARSVLRTLGECQPCSLEELHERVDLGSGLSLDEIQEILIDSAETGIVAFS
jgi:hypothetical protein